jgi:hypothetical protein
MVTNNSKHKAAQEVWSWDLNKIVETPDFLTPDHLILDNELPDHRPNNCLVICRICGQGGARRKRTTYRAENMGA